MPEPFTRWGRHTVSPCHRREVLTLDPDELETLEHVSLALRTGDHFAAALERRTLPVAITLLADYLATGPTTMESVPWRQRAAELAGRLVRVRDGEAGA